MLLIALKPRQLIISVPSVIAGSMIQAEWMPKNEKHCRLSTKLPEDISVSFGIRMMKMKFQFNVNVDVTVVYSAEND